MWIVDQNRGQATCKESSKGQKASKASKEIGRAEILDNKVSFPNDCVS